MSSYSSYFSQGEAIENMSSSSSSLPSTPPPFGALLSSNGTQLSFFYVEAIDTCELKNRGKDWRGNGNSILDKITKRETNKEREREREKIQHFERQLNTLTRGCSFVKTSNRLLAIAVNRSKYL